MARIEGWVRDYRDIEGVAPAAAQDALSVDEAMAQLRESAVKAVEAEEKLIEGFKREELLK